ncbi:MAG: TonB-dependent receptor, partial [Sulfurimonas sp.]
ENASTVSEALDNVSGVTQEIQGGRAESTLYIRGFDARRVGVFIDGVPVYVPYDGNFDYGRFLTTDIAEIDVSKGYSSVAYGANTMGGVINIVSKKPTKALEGSLRSHVVFDSDVNFARQVSALNVGTRQENYYIQLGANYANQDHFRLSDDFEPTVYQPSGDRLRSETEDKKVNLKAGYFIDEMTELALGYINQKGEKQQPPATDTDYSREKYWDWPYWDKETVYLNGQKIFDHSYLKAVLYYDKFKNSLYSYDNGNYNSFDKKYAFKSRYDDYSYGARLSYGTEIGKHLITLSANYKTDLHRGYDISKTDSTSTLTEKYEDSTLSFGIEDVYKISSQMELLGGISYDRKEGEYAYDEDSAIEGIPLGTQDTFNPQVAVLYKPDTSTLFRTSVARKTYLTSMKDRYSRRLGSAIPNPDLNSEKSTHYELSYHKNLQHTQIGITGFIAQVDDAIQKVIIDDNDTPDDTKDDLSQNRNIGEFQHRGIELDISYKNDTFQAGGNYTYLSLVNRSDNDAKLTEVPRHQLFAYVQKDLTPELSLYGNVKMRKGAYEQKMDGSYVINPTFTTLDAKVVYSPIKDLTTELGVKNLTDQYYGYDSAFPMPGREFFVTMEYKF